MVASRALRDQQIVAVTRMIHGCCDGILTDGCIAFGPVSEAPAKGLGRVMGIAICLCSLRFLPLLLDFSHNEKPYPDSVANDTAQAEV